MGLLGTETLESKLSKEIAIMGITSRSVSAQTGSRIRAATTMTAIRPRTTLHGVDFTCGAFQ